MFCKAPWVSLALQPNETIAPCCVYSDEYRPFTADFANAFSDLREQISAGIIPKGCYKCKQQLDQTGHAYNQTFDRHDITGDFSLEVLNVKSNKLCNAKCRSCGPHFSSKWESEIEGKPAELHDDRALENLALLDLRRLKMIMFAGGEPLINPDTIRILDMLVSQGQTDLAMHCSTNASTLRYKDRSFVDIWKKFPNFTLQVSIDAFGEQNDYVRSDVKWENVLASLDELRDSGIKHFINITVSALNVWFLKDLFEFLAQRKLLDTARLNLLQSPDMLRIDVIPLEFRQDILNMLRSLPVHDSYKDELNGTIKLLEHGDMTHLWQHFLLFNLLLDKKRNEKLMDILPIRKEIQDRWSNPSVY